jgi:DNA polymerase-3 subunit delta'
MIWDNITGQTEAVTKLRNLITSSTLSHAYLFVGPEGVGKKYTALNFACAVNCNQNNCDNCSICTRILNGVHPDVLLIEPEGNFITVGQVRDIQAKAGLKPFEAEKKVYIIDDVDRMNLIAANAFLKILEEPPENLIFILISSNQDEILPTITSRCQLIRFKSISFAGVIKFLMDKCNIDEQLAVLATRITGGALSDSLNFVKSEERLNKRDKIMNLILNIRESKVIEVFDIADNLVKIEKDSINEIKERQKKELLELESFVFNKSHASFVRRHLGQKHKKELNREEFNRIFEILNIFLSWYRDLLVFIETGQMDLITNSDRIDNIEEYSKKLNPSRINGAFEIILKAKEMIKFNVNHQLVLETMLFRLQEV